ncbi:MAG: hypothetical protein HOV96_19560 [Nonomuraea sp.]|nr:hypothetical protein [Nonomuraea sp.]
MNTTASASKPLNPTWEPYQAAAWLVGRHDQAQHILDRVDCWATEDNGKKFPDVQKLAEGINAADQYGVEWKAYEYSHPAPRLTSDSMTDEYLFDRAYEQWEEAGPQTDDPVALAYLPMSSGEKRLLRVLAILAPAVRVRFSLGDTDGIGLQCCAPGFYGAPPKHQTFMDDWRQLITGGVSL